MCPEKKNVKDGSLKTVVKMEVWPSGGGLQVLPPNNPMLLGRQGSGSERLGKAPTKKGHVCAREANESEPSMKRRNG